jgi:threonine synthase
MQIRCVDCSLPYPEIGLPYQCPQCGGLFDFDGPLEFDMEKVEAEQPGIWRYRHTFALFDGAPVLHLGEGNTPLLWLKMDGRQIGVKVEGQNPSGSFKDRGVAVTTSQLLAREVKRAVEDSSGNAGASFAAYSAKAGIHARVFVPEYASGPKSQQIAAYGAELVRVPGPRSAAADAVMEEALAGKAYASHAYLPFGLAGYATIAYELYEAMGAAPGTVVAPVGHGGLLLGLVRGFQALKAGGYIEKMPQFLGVQAANCAPVYTAFEDGIDAVGKLAAEKTIAGGVAVRYPKQLPALMSEMPSGLRMAAVKEEDIMPAVEALAHQGLYVEPSSALVWAALMSTTEVLTGPVVMVLSGSGLKYTK